MSVIGIRGEEFRYLFRGEGFEEHRAFDFCLDVPPQVPSHDPDPGQRVDGVPGLGFVIGVQEFEHRIFQTQRASFALGQIGVNSIGIGIQNGPDLLGQALVILFGQAPPAQGAQEGVGFHLGFPEHLRQTTGCGVTPDVHLPETVLGVDVSQGEEQVMRVGGVNVRDAVLVPVDVNGGLEPL